jgi:hypothetical protein
LIINTKRFLLRYNYPSRLLLGHKSFQMLEKSVGQNVFIEIFGS